MRNVSKPTAEDYAEAGKNQPKIVAQENPRPIFQKSIRRKDPITRKLSRVLVGKRVQGFYDAGGNLRVEI
jgi:hypothetical protein